MNKNDKASVSLRKILGISLILIFITSMGVVATNAKLVNVKIVLSSNYEMKVLTAKTKVSEILEENHITILEDEVVVPDINSEISENKTIKISKVSEVEQEVAQLEETVSTEQILESYKSVIEKIVTEQVVIPYETITKEAVGEGTKQNKVVQNGINGLKEVIYKVRYQNDVEIEKVELSSKVIKEPVNKIVEVKTIQVTSRSGERLATTNPAATASTKLAKSVEGITPIVKKFNTSAYCSCSKCCGKSTGITASGARASSWYTIAAGKGYKLGTVIYIPAFANKPNGGWFVVQDRGGAISNSKIDVYMGSHSEALQFGRKTLECYVYEF